MSKSESGSVHVVIITILAIALVGAVGTLFWQNVINKPKDSETKVATSTSPTPSPTPSTKTYCAPVEKLCFDYPSAWKVSTESVDAESDGMTESVRIADEKGQSWLHLQTGLTGVGGACGNDDNSYTKVFSTHSTAIEGSYLVTEGTAQWNSDTVYAASWMTYSGTLKNWTIRMELNTAKAVQSIAKIDPCDVGLGVINGKNAKAESMSSPGPFVFKYDAGANTNKTYANEAEATAALSTADAKKAFAILQSTRYE